MTVRAKLTLIGITHRQGTAKELHFTTLYDSSTPEDQRFTKATPWGEFKMSCDNPLALEQFELGKAYYVDFNPAT